MLGCELNSEKFEISIFERNATLGRKFLVAGDGGLNLTHSENEISFIKKYTPFSFLEKSFQSFSNHTFIKWLNGLGIPTFIGSSGRVFPKKGIKPAEVLNLFLKKIKTNSVNINTKYKWQGFSNNNHLIFNHNNDLIKIKSDYFIFCLGGASWPITGSKGDWIDYFEEKHINTLPFKASNCAFQINWHPELIQKIEGKALKNISITCNKKTNYGEIVITRFGLEGSGIYPLSAQIRQQLDEVKNATVYIDFKPDFSLEKIIEKIESIADKKNFTTNLKIKLNLSQLQIQLLKACLSKQDFTDVNKLSVNIKKFKLTIINTATIEESISTVGGISLNEINENFELKKLPGHFVIGEMLDYDAPTGGYLLQSCFSMAKYLAHYLNNKID